MKKFAVVIERGENNLSAYVPDLPGCITTGHTVEEIEHNMREAIELHLEGMIEDGEIINHGGFLRRASGRLAAAEPPRR